MKRLGLTQFILITLFLFFILAARSASAATHYVSTNGSASWSSCTVSNSPCSVSTALTNAIAGDTVNFLAGTYMITDNSSAYYAPALNPANSGTSGNPITFQANPGDTVTLIGAYELQGLIGSYTRNYITWKGFIVDTSAYGDTGGQAVTLNSCTGVVFDGLTLIGHHYSNNASHWSAIYSGVGSTNTTIRNCKIYGWSSPGEGAAIGLFNATGFLIENNEIYSNDRGISMLQSDSGTIRFNLIHDLSLGVHGPGNASNNSLNIYQNIFYNISSKVLDIEANWPSSYFYNNTIYNCPTGSGFWGIVTSTTSLTYYNNIYHTVTTPVSYNGVGIAYDDYNDFYNGGGKLSGFDANSMTTDPLFVNVTGHNFHLQPNSLARTYGQSGKAMGAYISGSETIGLTSSTSSTGSTSTPGAPIGLMVQ